MNLANGFALWGTYPGMWTKLQGFHFSLSLGGGCPHEQTDMCGYSDFAYTPLRKKAEVGLGHVRGSEPYTPILKLPNP